VQKKRNRPQDSAAGLIPALKAWLQSRFGLQLPGRGARAASRSAHQSPPGRPDALPPMAGRHVIAAHVDLRALLDHAPGARRVWPSLALLERVLGARGFDGIHRVDACVLRHAARSLDMMADRCFSPGLVVLRRRIELVLRRKHLDAPTHWARTPCPAGARRRPDTDDTLTDYIDLDRMFLSAAPGRAQAVRGGRRPTARPRDV
jgi:hypothetical protein